MQLRSGVDFFLFSGVFIASGAVLMCMGTTQYLANVYPGKDFLLFVFLSTICSYNFHWYLSPPAGYGSRSEWSEKYRQIHLFFGLLGGLGASFLSLFLHSFLPWLVFAGLLCFLYTAPKITHPFFQSLRKIAIGKTLYLAGVWTYVTCILPLVVLEIPWDQTCLWFVLSRFFLMYANCILFDLRDRQPDIREGIRSMVTLLSIRKIGWLFAASLVFFSLFGALATVGPNAWADRFILLIPGGLLAFLYRFFRKNQSDYVYYILLDGLLLVSPIGILLQWFL